MTLKRAGLLLAASAFAALHPQSSWQAQAAEPEYVVPLPAMQESVPAGPIQLTLEDAKFRALSASPVMALARMNTQDKLHALRAVHADYLPKVLGNIALTHFDSPLGSVITIRNAVNVPVNLIEQDQTLGSVLAVQPITDLLKVRGLERVTAADGRIADADVEKGRRAILSGAEQLYVGLWAAQHIHGGALAAAKAAEPMAKNGPPAVRAAYIEALQATQQAEAQVQDLQAQLNSLLNLPLGTQLELAELPTLNSPVGGAEEAAGLAVAHSPDVCQAQETIEKADAALKIAKSDFIPNVMAYGGYVNQNGIPAIQNNFGMIGLNASYTLFDAGKRRHLVHKGETDLAMAHTALRKTREEVALKAHRAYRTFEQSGQAVTQAQQMVVVRQEIAHSKLPLDQALTAAKDNLTAQVNFVQAQVAQRIAYAELVAVLGQQEYPICANAGTPIRR